MRISILRTCVAVLPLLSRGTLAAATPVEDDVKCVTLSASTPVDEIGTTTKTKTAQGTAEQIIAYTPTSIVTVAGLTSTTTVSSTITTTITGTASSGTFTTTVTTTNTVTSTTTQVRATTSTLTTTTTSTPLSTVATRSGFVPIRTSLPGTTNERPATSPRRLSRRGKQCKPRSSASQSSTLTTSNGASYPTGNTSSAEPCLPTSGSGPGYPSQVVCETTIGAVATTTITRTASPTTITTSASAIIKTSTVTVTLTSTIAGGSATATVTRSATQLTTTTVTTTADSVITATQIQTVTAPTATVFAACQGNTNYASYLNNNPVVQVTGFNFTFTQRPLVDSSSCCNSCLGDPQCAAFAMRTLDNSCFILSHTSGQCTQPRQYRLGIQYNSTVTTPNFVAGNGNCGTFDFSQA